MHNSNLAVAHKYDTQTCWRYKSNRYWPRHSCVGVEPWREPRQDAERSLFSLKKTTLTEQTQTGTRPDRGPRISADSVWRPAV